jgi:hypothetical protein
VKKFGPEAKAAREKAKAAEALEEERRKTAAMEKRAKEAEARNKQLELKLAADKLREQKQQRAMVEREKRFIAEGQNANASGSRGFAESETTKSFGASSSRGPTSSDEPLREDGYDRDRNWEPRGASLWDHVDAAARTKEKKKKTPLVSLESDDEGWIEARRPSTSRASFDASQRWAPQTPSFGPGVSIGPNAPPPSASMAAFPSLGGGDVGSPAGSSPIVSGHGSPSGPGFAFGTGPPSAVAAAAAAAAPADNPALALQVWMQRCRSGCPPGHEARPLLDDLIKKRVKSLIDSVGGVASRVDWASQDTSFAEQCVRRAEQERETLRALERARGGDPAAGDKSSASRPFILFGVDPSTIGADTGVAELVARHIRHLIQLCIERKEQNVKRFLAGTAFREDDDDTAASRLCAASVLRRAPEAAVNVLRSNGFEEWACRLHVLFWGSPCLEYGETLADFENADHIESRYASDEAKRWLTCDAYARMGFAPNDADAFELEGIPRRTSGVDGEALAMRDAYLLGLPRGLLETMVARNGGDVFRGVADALERAGAG